MKVKKCARRYQACLHYHLAKTYLTCEQFQVLTTLDAKEVNIYFNNSTLSIKNIIQQLGMVVLYQRLKLDSSVDRHQWLRLRQTIPGNLHLWSDCIRLDDNGNSAEICELQLGLSLLAVANRRQAIIWSLRLNIALFDDCFKVKSLERLHVVINRCLTTLSASFESN